MNSLSKEMLVQLLYLFMRDASPTGEVVRVVRMLKESQDHDEDVKFTSIELETYARRLASELLSENT